MNRRFICQLLIVLLSCRRIDAAFETPLSDSGIVSFNELNQLMSCIRRVHTIRVKQVDSQGRSCWDHVSSISCWGRCQTYEIPDWRFPFKVSHHPTCKHDGIQPRLVRLKNCDPAVAEGTEQYVVYDALSCRCQTCNSTMFNCEQLNSVSP